MPRAKKVVGKDDFAWVRTIYGKGPDAFKRYNYIPKDGMNKVLKEWQDKQPERERTVATPSSVLTCPRALWLQKQGVAPTNTITWALKQRMLLGRQFENQFADILKDQGLLLYHWKDDPGVEVEKFRMGEGDEANEGVPDYLLKLWLDNEQIVAISDAKTSRSDSFGYLPIELDELFEDGGWFKNRIQLTNYYMLCHSPEGKAWFAKHNLPLPTHCHLFSYALDDGVVRREAIWIPTEEDMELVRMATKRFNQGLNSDTMPECTCHESKEGFEVKFCKYGVIESGKKVAESCCDPSLAIRKE